MMASHGTIVTVTQIGILMPNERRDITSAFHNQDRRDITWAFHNQDRSYSKRDHSTSYGYYRRALFVRFYESLGSSETATGDGDGRAPQIFFVTFDCAAVIGIWIFDPSGCVGFTRVGYLLKTGRP